MLSSDHKNNAGGVNGNGFEIATIAKEVVGEGGNSVRGLKEEEVAQAREGLSTPKNCRKEKINNAEEGKEVESDLMNFVC